MLLGMPRLDRRRFLLASAATAALPKLRALAQAAAPGHAATLTLHADRSGPAIPTNFVGLSYETQQLSDPTFFSAANTGLIAQFRALSPEGVLRIGGNTSDVGWWKPTPSAPRPPINVRNTGVGEPNADLAYPITPESTVNLRAFLDATGWTCLYGINLGTNTPERAADQAVQVAHVLGNKLQYFQLGNEPDLFGHHMRDPKTWTADTYFDDWLAEANAIRARVPHARFGLPDTAGNPTWYATVVTRLLALANRPDVAALTHHYYFSGPPSNPDVNIPHLLKPDPRVLKLASDIHAAAARLSTGEHHIVPYRMTEGNTCFRGGKPGVSDVFAAALWAADYLLLLASLGYAGVNLHGGTGQFVANSLGGKLPGDDIVRANHDNPDLHPHPYYTPIANIKGQYVAEPVAYGMKFARNFAGATMFPVDFKPMNGSSPVDATAYAAKLPTGQKIVAIINKDATQPLPIDLPGYSLGKVLSAPGLTSRTADLGEPQQNREASTVPPATAVLLYASR
jgi:hypothetical protein